MLKEKQESHGKKKEFSSPEGGESFATCRMIPLEPEMVFTLRNYQQCQQRTARLSERPHFFHNTCFLYLQKNAES